MPSICTPLGALPARFRRPRVLVVGCGDVGQRVAQRLHGPRLFALTSSPGKCETFRQMGITPLLGNLDQSASLGRLSGLATHVLHLAPPLIGSAHGDLRTRALLTVLARRSKPAVLVYASTSGVYGDCAGAWVDEVRAVQPQTARAALRVDAETRVRSWGRCTAVRTSVLRIPGIYAADRVGGTPKERLAKGVPVLLAHEDVFSNHVHADDLARACQMALWRSAPQRVYNICDDTQVRMGDYYDLAADLYGVQRPRRISRAQAAMELSPLSLSFMRESRRLRNHRMKRELRMELHYPTVREGLLSMNVRLNGRFLCV